MCFEYITNKHWWWVCVRARDREKGKNKNKEKIVEKENKSIYVILEKNDFVACASINHKKDEKKRKKKTFSNWFKPFVSVGSCDETILICWKWSKLRSGWTVDTVIRAISINRKLCVSIRYLDACSVNFWVTDIHLDQILYSNFAK